LRDDDRRVEEVRRDDPRLDDDERLEEARLEDARLRDPLVLRGGTLAPLRRASLSPIAMACLRLVTLRPEPLFNVPRLRRRIVDSTFFDADLPYFAMHQPPLLRAICKGVTGAASGDPRPNRRVRLNRATCLRSRR
jgi:hypothetical protein